MQKFIIGFLFSLDSVFARFPIHLQVHSNFYFAKKLQTPSEQVLEPHFHGDSVCTDILENNKFSPELIKCLKQIAKDSYCGGSYDAKCLCDSDHFVFSTGYVKTYADCFRKFTYEEHYNFFSYFQELCSKTTSFNKECLKLNSPPKPIPCPDPYRGMDWGENVLNCLLKELERSNCKKPYDAHCLCDSQSHWLGVNKCLATAEINRLFMAQHIRKSLCHDPLSLSGCSGIDKESQQCPGVFEDEKLDGNLKICLENITKSTYCGGSEDPVCLCDSKFFEKSTSDLKNYPKCFSELDHEIRLSFLSFKHDICQNPKSPSNFFYELYKGLQLDETLKKCMYKAAVESFCKAPYKALCLCDSKSYWDGIQKCISHSNAEKHELVNSYLKSVCENPDSVAGSIKEDQLLSTCKDVYEGSKFSDKLKQCLRKIAEETRCGGSYDPVCLCDSIHYFDSTMYVSTYADCFLLFTVNEHLEYSDHYRSMCKNPQLPHAQCIGLRNPPPVLYTCSDIFKEMKLPDSIKECLNSALKKAPCDQPYDSLCLCDSLSFWNDINTCMITSDSEEFKAIREFHFILCQNPKTIPGCESAISAI
ncbi:unnamed protein product [Pneumocystis jirovecii]|uniref:Extracellular membrane protein CFEM domain-containing protein n=1 Tax=Pneumocystis jirovecii TaxID=42068 RepID=L0PDM7_PNEJI|nr:unnamed protein product [Pneumocystis jirovecii]